jgi:acyl carrier protein
MIASRLDVPVAGLTAELSFAVDLGADSLTRVDLVLLLEETLEVSVPDDSMFLVQSVGDAERYAVLFDRAREELVAELGEGARASSFDAPLADFGSDAEAAARRAAGRATFGGIELPAVSCRTLKDAVRLAFLAERLRAAFATAAGLAADAVPAGARPADLGLAAGEAARVVASVAAAMDLGALSVAHADGLTVADLVRALATAANGDGARR